MLKPVWQVVPLCKAQLQDVNPSDLLNGGLYRKCNTYKGGGGYDKFPQIFNTRMGTNRTDLNNQFVVQLKGCPLRCPYCYVTHSGIWGKAVELTTEQLVRDFRDSGCSVFHLMGGAPALYLNQWPDLLNKLNGEVFHSDFVPLEGDYDIGVLKEIASYPNSLYAVSIKGANQREFQKNTGVNLNEVLLEKNLEKLFQAKVPCYFTFTGMSEESIQEFIGNHKQYPFKDSFNIDLVQYKALDYKE